LADKVGSFISFQKICTFDKKKIILFKLSKENKNHAKGAWTILKEIGFSFMFQCFTEAQCTYNPPNQLNPGIMFQSILKNIVCFQREEAEKALRDNNGIIESAVSKSYIYRYKCETEI